MIMYYYCHCYYKDNITSPDPMIRGMRCLAVNSLLLQTRQAGFCLRSEISVMAVNGRRRININLNSQHGP